MIRNLSSSMDGPEVIMDAEEYLQPKSRCPLPSSSTATAETPLPPPTPVKKYAASSAGGGSIANGSEHGGGVYGAEGFSSQGSHRTGSPASMAHMGAVGHHQQHHLPGHHPGGGFHPQRDSGGPSLRYCSDPLQLIGKGKIPFLILHLKMTKINQMRLQNWKRPWKTGGCRTTCRA